MNCEICSSGRFVDAHHYDCREGKLSPETITLCRRCHRTYHDRGIEWFDDDKLDKAIMVENRHREIWNTNISSLNEERLAEAARLPYPWLKRPLIPLSPIKREDIRRSNYWNKTHNIRTSKQPPRETEEEKQLGFGMIDNILSGQ